MPKRSKSGKFVTSCANELHDQVAAAGEVTLDVERNGVLVSELSARVRCEWEKENGEKARILASTQSKRRYTLCSRCYTFFSNRADASASASSGSSDDDTRHARPRGRVGSIIEQLKTFNAEDLSEIATFLGESQQTSIAQDIKSLQHDNDVDALCDLNFKDWIKLRNPVVCSFLKGIIGTSSTYVDESKDLDFAKTIEQIYYLHSKNIVLPLSLSENLVTHAVTRSKIACNVKSSSTPAGSHSFILKWLKTQAKEPIPPPTGDVLIAFDNDQVIGKSYHVRADNKVSSSVITSTCIAEVGSEKNLQFKEELKPAVWLTAENVAKQVETVLDSASDINKAVDATHYKEVYKTLQERIDLVSTQHIWKNETWQDAIDDQVDILSQNKEWKLCWNCGTNNVKTKRVCVSCGKNLNRKEVPHEEAPSVSQPTPKRKPKTTLSEVSFTYVDTASEPAATPELNSVKVRAGEPVFVNPNSHASIIKVFQEIGKQTQISKYVNGGTRKWVIVTCDGLPFTIAQRVLKETFTCQECGIAIFTYKEYVKHCREHDAYAEADIPCVLEFDWLLLKIGHGHFEMNMVRSFFSLNWDVCIKDLAKCMGFCSETAQKYAKSASDHHKAWEMLQILYYGTLDELTVPYVRECLTNKVKASAEGFLRWSRNIKNPRCQYLQEQMLTYASAIMNLRRGIRHDDMALVLAARMKYAPIFHARNHPKYQRIELVEVTNFLAAPPPLQEFLSKYQAISTTGDPERCEDMDFILEAINKKSKAWAPRGVPSHQDWQQIFRNLGKFDQLRASVFKRTRLKDPDSGQPYTSAHDVHDDEIQTWRTHLRGSGYLQDPCNGDVPFMSVSSDKLDAQLVNLTEQAEKRRRYFASTVFGFPPAEPGSVAPDPVFVTEDERARHFDVRNQKKDVIASRVLSALDSLDDESVKTLLLDEWESSIKQKKKEDFISFYHRVQEEVANQQPVPVHEEEND